MQVTAFLKQFCSWFAPFDIAR